SAIREAESEALPSEVDMPTTRSKSKSKPDATSKPGPTPKASATPKPTATAKPAFPWEATDAELAALEALGKEGVWQLGGNDLKRTNLDKPIFEADPPVTKRELIRYFARIAPTMLPHLADRPLNLQRFPNGAGSPGFWQKDIPASAPAWLRRWREVGVAAREANEHLVADDTATLCWLGNQASFEIH